MRRALAALVLAACAASQPRGTIGAMLAQTPDQRLVVKTVPAGLGAASAGVLPGDEILLIDGRDARAMRAEEVHRVLSGEVGEPVKLTLVRDGAIVRVTVTRTPIPKAQKAPG